MNYASIISYILLSLQIGTAYCIVFISFLLFLILTVFTNVTVIATSPRSALSKGALVGIVLGTIAGAVTLSVVVSLLTLRAHRRNHPAISRRRHREYLMLMILDV